MFKKSILFHSLLLTGLVSTSANAATNTASVDVLKALNTASSSGIDTSWVEDNDWTGLAQNLRRDGVAWNFNGAEDPCGDNWAGIFCDGANITHIELPNAKMTSTLEQVFIALAPIKTQLVSINFSATPDGEDMNTLTGGIPAAPEGKGYSALVYLALNKVGANGAIRDPSSGASGSALALANFYDNNFSTFDGPFGGEALTSLSLYDNANLTGDLASTINAATNLVVLRSDNTQLTGGLEPVSDVTLAGAADKHMDISWTPAANGLTPASYKVQYTGDNGASWIDLPPVTSGNTVSTGVLANGTYGAKVTPQSSDGFIGSPTYTTNALVISDSGSTTGSGSGAGVETGGTTNGGSTGGGASTSDSGGGAVLCVEVST